MSQNPGPADPSPAQHTERLLVLLGYGLFLIAPPMGGITALVGVVVAHIRLAHAAGQAAESHYRNQIRVFWTMLAFALAMMLILTASLGLSLFSLAWPFAFGWPLWPDMAGHVIAWTMLLPFLGLLSLAFGIWYYWRLVRGFLRMLDDRPY